MPASRHATPCPNLGAGVVAGYQQQGVAADPSSFWDGGKEERGDGGRTVERGPATSAMCE